MLLEKVEGFWPGSPPATRQDLLTPDHSWQSLCNLRSLQIPSLIPRQAIPAGNYLQHWVLLVSKSCLHSCNTSLGFPALSKVSTGITSLPSSFLTPSVFHFHTSSPSSLQHRDVSCVFWTCSHLWLVPSLPKTQGAEWGMTLPLGHSPLF